MSRVQTVYIPTTETFEPYVRSLCHMARMLDQDSHNYNKMKHVVIIGTSKRMAEAYVKQLIGSKDLPRNLICFGCDESPINHREFTYLGSHVILLPELNYASEHAVEKISKRVLEMILSLKQMDGDKELKNGCLTLAFQNPMLWAAIRENGKNEFMRNHKHVLFMPNLASTITAEQLFNEEELRKATALTVTLGQDFLVIKTEELIPKLHNLLWLMSCDHKDYKLYLHDDFYLELYEQYLLYDFQGF